MSAHSTYVQMVGPGGFFAACTQCGSDGFPNRATLDAAENDARRHGNLDHIYPRADLIAHEDKES